MNEVELTQLGIKDSRDLLNKKEISATELTNAYIQNIEESSKLNAFIEKTVISNSVILSDCKIYGATIKKSIIGPDVSLNHDTENTVIAPEGEKIF